MSKQRVSPTLGDQNTNTTTYFMREPEAIEEIANFARNARRDIRIWSVGCSSGEEPFSVAIAIRNRGANAQITASDVNPAALQQARGATYSQRSLRHVSATDRDLYFKRHGERFEVIRPLRDSVRFRAHDIVSGDGDRVDNELETRFDVVLCRNVLVYHSNPSRRRALERMVRGLVSGGMLFMGGAEWLSLQLRGSSPILASLEIVEYAGGIYYRTGTADAAVSAGLLPHTFAAATRDPAPRIPSLSPRVGPIAPASVDFADMQLDAGSIRPALKTYRDLSAAAPLDVGLHFRIAYGLMLLDEVDLAKESLRRAIFLEHDHWPSLLLLCELMAETDPKGARKYLEQANRSLDSNPVPYDSLRGFVPNTTAARELLTVMRTAVAAEHRVTTQQKGSP